MICHKNHEGISNILEVKEYSIKEFSGTEEMNESTKIVSLVDNEKKCSDDIKKLLTWTYERENVTKIEGKTSVTRISKYNGESKSNMKKPQFLSEKLDLTRAEIGTTIHIILQKLNFSMEYNHDEIEKLINQLKNNDIITKKQAESIRISDILNFTSGSLYKRIFKSNYVYKEKPFYMFIPAKEIYNTNADESILVQGIIDLYFVDEMGNIILVDYKTDYIAPDGEDVLKERYEEQLNLYKKALEQATNKKVTEVYIYSTSLGKEIQIN